MVEVGTPWYSALSRPPLQSTMDKLELDNSKLTTCALELDNFAYSALELDHFKLRTCTHEFDNS